MAFGNVKVAYAPCKSVGQLKAAEKYMLGKNKEQIKQGIVKTQPDLYTALGCNPDNFSNNILVTRKLHGKSYSKLKNGEVLAHKMSISFHPNDNEKLDYKLAFEIAKQFAEKFMYEKGYEILFAVHTDTKHIHVHFLISNCNMDTGKAYRRNQADLYEMSEYLGGQCEKHELFNSVRENYFAKKKNKSQDKIFWAERKMTERGRETWKEELREVVRKEVADPVNRTFDDVIRALRDKWNVESRVAGNTISYRHPAYKDKNNNLVSVRGSKLGEQFTVGGIKHELDSKSRLSNIGKIAQYNGRSEQTCDTSIVVEGTDGRGSGEQVAISVTDSNSGTGTRNIDSFFKRYRKRVKDDERNLDEPFTDDIRETDEQHGIVAHEAVEQAECNRQGLAQLYGDDEHDAIKQDGIYDTGIGKIPQDSERGIEKSSEIIEREPIKTVEPPRPVQTRRR